MDRNEMLALADGFLAAWTSQDVERILGCYTDDLVYLDPNTRGPVRGREAMRRYLTKLFAAWTMSWSLREAQLFESGDGCAVLWHARLQRVGGPPMEADGMDLVEMRGDRICRNEVFFDRTVLSGGLETEALKQLLLRGWMTHDAMWFKNAVDMVGIATANRLNRAAVRDMAPIEVRRVLKAIGMECVTCFEELQTFLGGAMSLLGGDFMEFRWEWRLPDTLIARVDECFAYKGIKRIGVIESYECGIFDRIYAWFAALGVGCSVVPDVEHCTMHRDGSCVRELRFSFDEERRPAIIQARTDGS